ncbi:MAG: alpha/beta fold hydrolase [Desulfobacter sp.]|nr:MAG: alpha/beta fold hydrolase [Desulfobacter sp.]
MPNHGGPFPAVILIAGSGPHDRDETIAGHKPLLVLADYLTRHGWAVLRYDKRGIGKSSGAYTSATFRAFAADAAAAREWLQKNKDIDPNRIGFAGHSSGGYIAPMAAEINDAAFLILLAAPARDLGEPLIRQHHDIARAQKKENAWIEQDQAWINEFVHIFKSAPDPATARRKVLAAFDRYSKGLKLQKKDLLTFLGQAPPAWLMFGCRHDPMPGLQNFKGPVLALFCSKDLQVSAQENVPAMKAVLGHGASKVMVFQGLNHLFQPAKTGLPEEYAWIDTTFDEAAMNAIAEWLNQFQP